MSYEQLDNRKKFEAENELKHILNERSELERELIESNESDEIIPHEKLKKFDEENHARIEDLRDKISK